MTDSKAFPVLIGIGGVAFGILFLFLGRALWAGGRELRRQGTSTHADVVRKWRKADDASWGGMENCYIQCRYTNATGSLEEIELKVQSRAWRQISEGGRVWLSYIPGRPQSVVLGPFWAQKLRGLVGIVLMLAGTAALVVFPWQAVREVLLASRR